MRQLPFRLATAFHQGTEETLVIGILREDALLLGATIHHVIPGVRVLKA